MQQVASLEGTLSRNVPIIYNCAITACSQLRNVYHFLLYLFSKKKYYDGSSTLKIIGNDCKLLEENIDVFLDTFRDKDKGESWESPSMNKLKQVLLVYKQFRDLASYILYNTLFFFCPIIVIQMSICNA